MAWISRLIAALVGRKQESISDEERDRLWVVEREKRRRLAKPYWESEPVSQSSSTLNHDRVDPVDVICDESEYEYIETTYLLKSIAEQVAKCDGDTEGVEEELQRIRSYSLTPNPLTDSEPENETNHLLADVLARLKEDGKSYKLKEELEKIRRRMP